MSESIVWYDLETFGTDPRYDRIAQYASVRTGPKLEEIPGDPLVLYCKPTPDYLPDPKSSLITGIGPRYCLDHGLDEHRFFGKIQEELSQPETCTAGFNSIRFDDEFIRFGLFRNLREPYRREYADGNSRWDILDLFRAAYDLRPEGIVWPQDADGKSSFKLEFLSKANGIEHGNAHDALADVHATIAIARLLRQKQTKFFDWFYKNRTKEAVKRHVNLHTKAPFVHTSGMLSSPTGYTTLVAPLALDPGNSNTVLCYDLRYDPRELLDLSVEAIRKRLFTKSADLEDEGVDRIHIKGLHLNRSPIVAPQRILEEDNIAARLGVDLELCKKHWKVLQSDPTLTQKIMKVYEKPDNFGKELDPDMSLYEGFIPDADRNRLDMILFQAETDPKGLAQLLNRLNFSKHKLTDLAQRFIARNFPESLSQEDAQRWKSFCASRLLVPPEDRLINIDFYERKIAEHMADTSLPVRSKMVLADLLDWSKLLREKVLSY